MLDTDNGSLQRMRWLPTRHGGLGGLALAALAGLPADAPSAASVEHAPIGGIYVVSTAKRLVGRDPKIDAALANPNVDGAYISLNWDTIEPERGRFDWTDMDAEVALVGAQHKKVSLAVVPGQYTPEWVYRDGARHFDGVVEPSFARDFCAPIRLPIPWDPVYLDAWTELIRAFGARYAGNPTLSFIKVTGVSYRTDETSLPFGTYAHLPPDRVVLSPRTGAPCVIPDDLGQWQRDGYTWAAVDGAFERIVVAFKAAFPGLPMGIMTSDHSFPPLSRDGRHGDPAGYALSTTDFFGIGRRLLGSGFIGQFNGLTAKQVNAGVAAFAATNPTGYQTGMPVHAEPFCIMNGRSAPCDESSVFQGAVNQALAANARYIEMFYDDINNGPFQDILARTRQRLSR